MWTAAEKAVLRRLRTPEKIQAFLDEELAYHHAETCYSPRLVLRHRRAHCMEGAMLAAAALRFHGDPPLIIDLTAVRDDDHVLAVFRRQGRWGAIAKSNYSGLRSRTPVYRNLRELALSYFEDYYNLRGEKTLRGYASRPVNLARFDALPWTTREEDPWEVPEYLTAIAHTPLFPELTRRYHMDARLLEAGKVGQASGA
ncbi:MAG: hypothetical protein K2X03_14200 [Bryobacteraceae bacterium]|nr:hypothetical protein [Bryobacteraceae bacterium]